VMSDPFEVALSYMGVRFQHDRYWAWEGLRPNIALLRDATSAGGWGGKAATLGALLRAGLRVPTGIVGRGGAVHGFFCSRGLLDALLEAIPEARSTMPLVLRSSAVGEDGLKASFAGRYESYLNLYTTNEVVIAAKKIRESATSERVMSYRRKMGLSGSAELCVIMQRMIIPSHSAVVFTRDPVSGSTDIVLELTEGTGDRLVGGEVEPATWNYERAHDRLFHAAGPRTDAPSLQQLMDMAQECEAVIGAPADVEAVFDGRVWWVVQARPITTLEVGRLEP